MTDLQAVLARLEHLERIEAARTLTARYARACDTGDMDGLAELFTDDAVLVVSSGPKEGREAVMAYYRKGILGNPAVKRHWLMNHEFDVAESGEIAVTTYFIYTYAGDDTSIIGWGDYRDDVVVADGVARFRRKAITLDVSADVRAGWAT